MGQEVNELSSREADGTTDAGSTPNAIRANYCEHLTGFVNGLATVSKGAFEWRSHMNQDPPKPGVVNEVGASSICYAMVSESIAKTAALIQSYCAFESCEKKYEKAKFISKVTTVIDKTTFGRRPPVEQEDKPQSLAAGLLAARQIASDSFNQNKKCFGQIGCEGQKKAFEIK